MGAPYSVTATFTDTTNSAPWTYAVSWGDGSSNSSGTKDGVSPIVEHHIYTTDGDYDVTVSVTNQRGTTGRASLKVDVDSITRAAPVILAAGDIAECLKTSDGTPRLSDDSTADLLDTLQGIVFPLGDNAYEHGFPTEYANCYAPTWGRQKGRSYPVAGNHDYDCQPQYFPAQCTRLAQGYFDYFGAVAGDPSKGYYDLTLGSWFVIVLNTGSDRPSLYDDTSAQVQWLRAELASHSQQCVVALFHHPRFSTVAGRDSVSYYTKAIWDALYQYGADLVLNGHDHAYQRFAPQKPDGTRDDAFGIRQIAVGTGGGETLYDFKNPPPAGSNIEVRNNKTHGVLKVTLRDGGYDWQFLPVRGETFTDSGSATCHGRPM